MLDEKEIGTVRETLKKLSFYEFLKPQEVEKLILGFEKAQITKGDVLINQGKSGEIFYILASGAVGVFRKRAFVDKQITTLGPGDFFGEMSLLTYEPRSATVVCEQDGVAYTLLRRVFIDVIMDNPLVADLMKKTAAKRRTEIKHIEANEWLAKS